MVEGQHTTGTSWQIFFSLGSCESFGGNRRTAPRRALVWFPDIARVMTKHQQIRLPARG